jgi:ribosome-binding factor A
VSRIGRVSEEIRFQVSMILHKDLHDPRIGFITITRVDISPDLRSASIYFTTIKKPGTFEDTLKALKASRGFIRSQLAKRMSIKFVPKITFINDASWVETNRIDEIIDMLYKEKERLDGADKHNQDNKG